MPTVTAFRPATQSGAPAIERRPFASLGKADHGWLNANHHFSFASYYDPQRMNWGAIRVWNDDEIAPRSGFPPHPHDNMEIITYVREGAITHRDSMGNEGRTEAGDIQVMSAGTGVQHSEANVDDETTRLFQIWIMPRERNIAPRWDAKPFPKANRSGAFVTLASGDEADTDALYINADAKLLCATLEEGQTIQHRIEDGRHAYLVPVKGGITINGETFDPRDGAAIRGGTDFEIRALSGCEIVMIDSI